LDLGDVQGTPRTVGGEPGSIEEAHSWMLPKQRNRGEGGSGRRPESVPLLGSATLSSESITLGPTEWQIDLVSALGMGVVGALLRIMALVALLRRH